MTSIRQKGAAIRILGDKATIKALEGLGRHSSMNRVLRPAVTAALRPIAKEAKRRVPTKWRFLKKALGIRTKTYRTGIFGAVGVRSDERWWGTVNGRVVKPHKYGHVVELGSKRTRPHPFLRPALDAKRASSLAKFKAVVAVKLPIEVARERAKARRRQ